MVTITIQGTPISFPSSGESPNWAPAIIQFAQAVATALSGVAGPFDIPPQLYVIDSYNPGSNVSIPALNFPISNVRAAFIKYSVYRTTNTTTAYEAGELLAVYNPNNSVGNQWEIIRESAGDGSISFKITDVGQVQFTTTALSGINHTGVIAFSATTLLQR